MFFENVVFDAADPHALGRAWEARLGTETLTDDAGGYETRLEVPGGPVLDLCFQSVAEATGEPGRLRLLVDETGERPVLATITLDVADPAGERDFWAWLTGWVPVGAHGLQHPSYVGPVLELRAESAPKGAAKNEIHLDVRLEAGDDADAVAREIAGRGGAELHLGFGDLPWRHFADPSGNEFCVLPFRG